MKNYNITSYADLEREEKKVRSRIRKQEGEIASRMKQLPEELIAAGITKVIRSVMSGNALSSGMSIMRSIASHFFNKENTAEENGGEKKKGFKGIIFDVLKGMFKNNFSAE